MINNPLTEHGTINIDVEMSIQESNKEESHGI